MSDEEILHARRVFERYGLTPPDGRVSAAHLEAERIRQDIVDLAKAIGATALEKYAQVSGLNTNTWDGDTNFAEWLAKTCAHFERQARQESETWLANRLVDLREQGGDS